MIKSLNDIFDRVYLISDGERPDPPQLRRLNITYEKVTLKKPRDYKTTQVCKQICTDYEIELCSAHKRVWRHIVDHNVQSAIVLLDDIELSDDFYKDLSRIWLSIGETPYTWDLIRITDEPVHGNIEFRKKNLNDVKEKCKFDIYALNYRTAKLLSMSTPYIRAGNENNMIWSAIADKRTTKPRANNKEQLNVYDIHGLLKYPTPPSPRSIYYVVVFIIVMIFIGLLFLIF